MNSRERLLSALNHEEPDHVPFDLGGSPNAGIHVQAYKRLLGYWRSTDPVEVEDIVSQRALVGEAQLRRLGVDTRKVDTLPYVARRQSCRLREDDRNSFFTDDWGITWVKPKRSGLYYDVRVHPLGGSRLTAKMIDDLPLPALPGQEELEQLKKNAVEYRQAGYPVILDGIGGGMFEHACFVRGHKDVLMDVVLRRELAERLLDRLLDYRLRYWECMLGELGEYVDVVSESDDVASQERLIISPELYRSMLKPRHRELINHIRSCAPERVYVLMHSCGAIKELIPDLLDVGVDAINPVQVSAAGMDTKELKKAFGRELTFWGGGVDTQRVLPYGDPQEVRDEVRRRIDDLAPGGGFVFAPVHNVQADVPPENIMAMRDALTEYGQYDSATC